VCGRTGKEKPDHERKQTRDTGGMKTSPRKQVNTTGMKGAVSPCNAVKKKELIDIKGYLT
jgi:hypothetical protein